MTKIYFRNKITIENQNLFRFFKFSLKKKISQALPEYFNEYPGVFNQIIKKGALKSWFFCKNSTANYAIYTRPEAQDYDYWKRIGIQVSILDFNGISLKITYCEFLFVIFKSKALNS